MPLLARKASEQHSTQASLEGKVCIVTGANSGVGYETALRLARAGVLFGVIWGTTHIPLCRNQVLPHLLY